MTFEVRKQPFGGRAIFTEFTFQSSLDALKIFSHNNTCRSSVASIWIICLFFFSRILNGVVLIIPIKLRNNVWVGGRHVGLSVPPGIWNSDRFVYAMGTRLGFGIFFFFDIGISCLHFLVTVFVIVVAFITGWLKHCYFCDFGTVLTTIVRPAGNSWSEVFCAEILLPTPSFKLLLLLFCGLFLFALLFFGQMTTLPFGICHFTPSTRLSVFVAPHCCSCNW